MVCNTKIVRFPLLISDMDTDLESKTVYIFDYDNSEKYSKPSEYLDAINNIGIISDILFKNTPEQDRFEILQHYMTSSKYNHILSLNVAIMNCIYKIKNVQLRLKGSALTNEMENTFVKNNKELLNNWIEFIDSYLIYMIMFSTNKGVDIKTRYQPNQITTDNSLSPNIVSLFLDDFFYDYYKTGINENSVKYWKYYYENKLYDNKSFNIIMLNDANFIIRVLHNTANDSRWKEFLEKRFQ